MPDFRRAAFACLLCCLFFAPVSLVAQTEPSGGENFTEDIWNEVFEERVFPAGDSTKNQNVFARFTTAALLNNVLNVTVYVNAGRKIADFALAERTALGLQAVALVLVASALQARRRKRKKAALRPGPAWFDRPISVAVLVAIALTPLVYANIPGYIYDLCGLIALLPAARILAPQLHQKFRRLLLAFAAITALDFFRRVCFEDSNLDMIFPLEMICAALAIVLIRTNRESASRGIRLAVWYGQIRLWLAGVFLLAAVSDLAGYQELARYAGAGLLFATAAVPALIAVVRAVHDTLVYILDFQAAGWSLIRPRRLALQKSTLALLRKVAVLCWVVILLAAFHLLSPVYRVVYAILTYNISLGSFAFSPGDLAAFAVIFWSSLRIARVLRTLLTDAAKTRLDMDRGATYALVTVAEYVTITLGFVFGITAAGFDLTRLAIVAGALGVGVGLGLQDIVKNFVSGLVLLFERPISIGDYIEVDGMVGQVERIGIRSSTVRIVDGSDVIIPNGMLISEKVRNWTLTDYKRRIDINVGVAYGTDPKKVIAILSQIALRVPDRLATEDPQVYFTGFGESSLDFSVRVFTDKIELRLQIQSDLTVAIYAALNEAGIEIPFPQRDLHLRSVPERMNFAPGPAADQKP